MFSNCHSTNLLEIYIQKVTQLTVYIPQHNHCVHRYSRVKHLVVYMCMFCDPKTCFLAIHHNKSLPASYSQDFYASESVVDASESQFKCYSSVFLLTEHYWYYGVHTFTNMITRMCVITANSMLKHQ